MANFVTASGGSTRANMKEQMDELGLLDEPKPAKVKPKGKEPKVRPSRRPGESDSSYASRYSESIGKGEAEGEE